MRHASRRRLQAFERTFSTWRLSATVSFALLALVGGYAAGTARFAAATEVAECPKGACFELKISGNIKAEPNPTSADAGSVTKGDRVRTTGAKQQSGKLMWVEIETGDGAKGWVPQRSLKPAKPTPAKKVEAAPAPAPAATVAAPATAAEPTRPPASAAPAATPEAAKATPPAPAEAPAPPSTKPSAPTARVPAKFEHVAPVASISFVEGDGTLIWPDGSRTAAGIKMDLRVGDKLVTGRESSMVIVFPPDRRIVLLENTTLTIDAFHWSSKDATHYDARVSVQSGAVETMFAPVPSDDEKIEIKAALLDVRVLGRRVGVRVDVARNAASAYALQGAFEASSAGRSMIIGDTFGVTVSRDDTLLRPRQLPAMPAPVEPFDGQYVPVLRFTWLPIEEAASYRFRVTYDAEGSFIAHEALVTGNEYAPPSLSIQTGPFFWSVSSVDSQGFISRPCKSQKFILTE